MPFNPFGKRIGELREADLRLLLAHQVAEGYYVEYKQLPPGRAKIGHSIAALANTNGGWFFIGIVSDEHNVANAVPGFPIANLPDPTATLRDVVKSHVHPVPLFTIQVVELVNGNAVAVVYVPENQDTPFVTKDGRIYRRAADSSEPVPETDRHALDRLYERGRKAKARFAQLCQDERAHSKSEENQGWAGIYLSPYPYGGIDRPELLTSEGVANLIEQSRTQQTLIEFEDGTPLTGNLPFDSAYSTPDSVVLQQRATNRIEYNSLSVELFTDGRARIHVPLVSRAIAGNHFAEVKTSRVQAVLRKVFPDSYDSGLGWLRFVDLGLACLAVGSLVNWYVAWLGGEPNVMELDIAVRLHDVWRSVPFSDTGDWAGFVERFGLPVLRTGTVAYPREDGGSIRVALEDTSKLWIPVCVVVAQALGFPTDVSSQLVVKALIDAANEGAKPG